MKKIYVGRCACVVLLVCAVLMLNAGCAKRKDTKEEIIYEEMSTEKNIEESNMEEDTSTVYEEIN